MDQNWKSFKLGEIGDIQTGPFGSQLHQSDYVTDGTPLITVKNLGENRITYNNLDKVKNEDVIRLAKYKVQLNDIVFSRVGYVDRCAIITKNEVGWLISGSCLRLRINVPHAFPMFVSYQMTTEKFKNYITNHSVGATRPSLNTSLLSNAPIFLPPVSEQCAIASILTALDDKIELNLQMNKTLEEMAKTLYKHWFIDFGPFRDGEFVSSELGEIPKGWEVLNLASILEIKYGKDHKQLQEGNIPVYGSGGIMRYVDRFLYDQESILIPRKGSLSNLFYIDEPFWSVDTMFYSRIKRENFGLYAFQFLKTQNLASMDVGSAIPSLTTELLNKLVILVPSDKEVKKFHEIVKGYYNLIFANKVENQSLALMRDTLLPKLISGEVRVKETSQILAEVI